MDLYRRSTIIALAGLLFFISFITSAWSGQDVSGQILIEPPFPAPKMMTVKKKVQDSCASEQLSQALLVSPQGGVANVVLWLDGKFDAPQNQQAVILDQSHCNFDPHVLLIPPGGHLEILNSDPLAHDVRAFDTAMMLFRLDMDTHSKPEIRSFEKPGIYTMRCGVHPWMHAFVVQMAHSYYAVSNESGGFVLKDVPAGEYTLHIWHETLGEIQKRLVVTEGSAKDFSYTFKQ